MSTYIPSLAASTGTRVDSAAKHNMACKVDTNLVKSWLEPGGDLDKRLHTERMRFAVQKDELVMNVSHRMFQPSAYNAYPAILSNLAEMHADVKSVLWYLYSRPNASEFRRVVGRLKTLKAGQDQTAAMQVANDINAICNSNVAPESLMQYAKQLGHMPYFRAQGFALGTGYASSVSGDTVCTVMIGGMHSCMNGAFTCHAGDMLQWYFTGEEVLFQQGDTNDKEDGERLDAANNISHSRKRARDYHDMYAFGSEPITDKHKSNAVFRVKPYRMVKDTSGAKPHYYKDHYGDKIRVFAKCIGGARPYEMMDIMLLTQSL